MSLRGKEYRPRFLPYNIPDPGDQGPIEKSLTLDNRLQQYMNSPGLIPDWVIENVGRQIDALAADGGIAAFCGSVRRLYSMFGIVPALPTIVQEINYLAGVGFEEYPIRERNYHLPVSSILVENWKLKRDTVIEWLLPYGLRWAKWFTNQSLNTNMTLGEVQAASYEVVFKIVTFNCSWQRGANGVRLQKLIMASMKSMLYYHDRHKLGGGKMELYDDWGTTIDDPIDIENTFLRSHYGRPEPDRHYPVNNTYTNAFTDATRPAPELPQLPTVREFKHLSLNQLFGLLQTLPSLDQYLLLSYFGYLNPGDTQTQYAAKVGVTQYAVKKTWHNLYKLVTNSHGRYPQPGGNLRQMISQHADAKAIRQNLENDRQQKFIVARLIQALGNRDPQTIAELNPNEVELIQLLLDSQTNKNGVHNYSYAELTRILSTRFRSVRSQQVQLAIKQITAKLQETSDNQFSWERFKTKKSINLLKDEVFEWLLALPPEQVRTILTNLTPSQQAVLITRLGLDGSVPKTFEQTAKLLGYNSKQRAEQIEFAALTRLDRIRQGHPVEPKPYTYKSSAIQTLVQQHAHLLSRLPYKYAQALQLCFLGKDGQILNFAEVAERMGVAVNTARNYISTGVRLLQQLTQKPQL